MSVRDTENSRLTVKLRGRAEAPDQSRGCTLSPSTRGDTPDFHGPLQRWLDARLCHATSSEAPSIQAPQNNADRREQQRAE